MKRFDCLDRDCPIKGPHILEASAGTGKTFAIEHVVARLLLQGVPIEEILIVTFTRAATRELKERIFSNTRKALACIREEVTLPEWKYLGPLVGSQEAILSLSNALRRFDQCQIFTIHGFCFRMLKEFSFEALSGTLLENTKHPVDGFRSAISSLKVFLEKGLKNEDVCPEQLSLLLGEYDTLYEWSSALIRIQPKEKGVRFESLYAEVLPCVQGVKLDLPLVLQDFEKIRTQYKGFRSDMNAQLECLVRCIQAPDDSVHFRKLIQSQGTLFTFLYPENRKVRAKEVGSLHYPDFWGSCLPLVGEIVLKGANRKWIEAVLVECWKEWERTHQKSFFQPDDILSEMQQAIEVPLFVEKLKTKYRAVIIDEFQDTDPLQWDIFEKLFLKTETFYLVGDPKQSIYRFRNADVYTYLRAKEKLGEENLYHLDTNFRSSQELIGVLNALFSRNWLNLPKIKSALPYIPVRAGSLVSSDLQDEKKALHWILGGDKGSYLETFLPYTVAEIKKFSSFEGIAVLVKDRYELQSALDLFTEHEIPCVARSHTRLADTYPFQALRELMSLLAAPQNENLKKIVEAGPWEIKDADWALWQEILVKQGLSQFFSAFCKTEYPFQQSFIHIMEELFAWEAREGFSFVGIERFFREFAELEGNDAVACRMKTKTGAVQVMTLHMSKGLEFDVVFALALASSSSVEEEEKEELNAEKLRQLYVAMTRAKKRLYVPVNTKKGSSLDLLRKCIEGEEGPFVSYLESLKETHSISMEEVLTPFILPNISSKKEEDQENEKSLISQMVVTPSYIESFTSLAQTHEMAGGFSDLDLQELPAGKETGTVIHKVFETLFQGDDVVWKEGKGLQELVEETLEYTFLAPWKEKVLELIQRTLAIPLCDGKKTFSLKSLSKESLYPEMEFLYEREGTWIKGFIDLVFTYEEKLYIIDWKTNLLGSHSMKEVMDAHDYPLQAQLYKEALLSHFEKELGGAFYLFVRTGEYVFV